MVHFSFRFFGAIPKLPYFLVGVRSYKFHLCLWPAKTVSPLKYRKKTVATKWDPQKTGP